MSQSGTNCCHVTQTQEVWIIERVNRGSVHLPREAKPCGGWSFNGDFERPVFSLIIDERAILAGGEALVAQVQALWHIAPRNHVRLQNGSTHYVAHCHAGI